MESVLILLLLSTLAVRRSAIRLFLSVANIILGLVVILARHLRFIKSFIGFLMTHQSSTGTQAIPTTAYSTCKRPSATNAMETCKP
jgi:disulfide bond formation protein DsbB